MPSVSSPLIKPLRSAISAPFAQDEYWRLNLLTGGLPSNVLLTRATTGRYGARTAFLATAAINEARLDINPVTLAPRGLLTELGSTNLILWSEDFTNGAWIKNGSPTVTSNAATAPDGNVTADMFARTVTSPTYCQQARGKAASALSYTTMFFVKKNVGNFFPIRMQGLYPNRADVCFNIVDGTISTAASVTGTFAAPTAGIYNFGNGWFFVWLSATTDTYTTVSTVFSTLSINGQIDATDSASNSSVYIWGAQLEQATLPSSYIPTTTAQATRSADTAQINDLSTIGFNNGKGTFVVEFELGAGVYSTYSDILAVSKDTSNSIEIFITKSDGKLWCMFNNAGVNSFLSTSNSVNYNAVNKAAISYDSAGNSTIVLNGVSGGAGATAARTVPTGLTTMWIMNKLASQQIGGRLRDAKYKPKTSTLAELILETI